MSHSSTAPSLPRTADGVFWRQHLLLPLAVASVLLFLLMGRNGDQWLADLLYRWQGEQWALKDAWLTAGLAHVGGKWLSIIGGLSVIALCLRSRHRHDRAGFLALLYLLGAVALSTLCVSLLKSATHMDCPWDLLRYGGQQPFIGLLQPRPAALGTPACFPAGQASAGYAWLALYFFALLRAPRWRWPALAVGLAAGLLLGGAQQLRGAHFLSHDVATALVCWCIALGLYTAIKPAIARADAPASAKECL